MVRSNFVLGRLALACALTLFALGCPDTGGKADGGTGGGAGGGAAIVCAPGGTLCDGACVDVTVDNANCGSCGTSCGVGRICSASVCVRNCPAGEGVCGDLCVDVKNDLANCGACGNICVSGQQCLDGGCTCVGAENLFCDGVCYNPRNDVNHCGSCGTSCDGGYECLNSVCEIVCDVDGGETKCNADLCANLSNNVQHCGACGRRCPSSATCGGGQCDCGTGRSLCGTAPNWQCIDTANDNMNCGGCGITCATGQTCAGGACENPCPTGTTRCSGACLDTRIEPFACGSCTNACTAGQYCDGGSCEVCNSATTDCDGDGWKVSDGDCCDTPGACGAANPKLVNPGAFEISGNSVDDNCNGLQDNLDVLDTQPCDNSLVSNSVDAGEYAQAMGICRTTLEVPTSLQTKTWGLISAQLLRVDGTNMSVPDGVSIRGNFGSSYTPLEGAKFAVISSGIAADATQTNPGPNGGPLVDQSNTHGLFDMVDISSCTNPLCIKDWYSTANQPLKAANALPEAPNCNGSNFGTEEANDSVMLVLRLRAPTNARAFTFRGLFLSTEYPEYVCTDYNDQFIALVKTPGNSPAPVPNPIDYNLMTYLSSTGKWPIGINVAKGTDLFKVCEAPGTNLDCDDSQVSVASCGEGVSKLAGTGFESPGGGFCAQGGATKWLETAGNVVPGQIVELRIAVWDVGDDILDSTAILDGFKWLTTSRTAGTD